MKDYKYFKEYVLPLSANCVYFGENCCGLGSFEDYKRRRGEENAKYYLAEAHSRNTEELCLSNLARKQGWIIVDFIHQGLKSRFDTLFVYKEDGVLHKVPVEMKERAFCYDTYPTQDIDVDKGEFISGKEGWVVIHFLEDNKYFVFDLSTYTPEIGSFGTGNGKPTSTVAYSGEREYKDAYKFDTDEAIYSGKIKKITWEKDFYNG